MNRSGTQNPIQSNACLYFKQVALGLIITGTVAATTIAATGPRVTSALAFLGNLNYTDLTNRLLEEITMPKITDRALHTLHALHPGDIASNITKAASEGKWPELDILLPENLLMVVSIYITLAIVFAMAWHFIETCCCRR